MACGLEFGSGVISKSRVIPGISGIILHLHMISNHQWNIASSDDDVVLYAVFVRLVSMMSSGHSVIVSVFVTTSCNIMRS